MLVPFRKLANMAAGGYGYGFSAWPNNQMAEHFENI